MSFVITVSVVIIFYLLNSVLGVPNMIIRLIRYKL